MKINVLNFFKTYKKESENDINKDMNKEEINKNNLNVNSEMKKNDQNNTNDPNKKKKNNSPFKVNFYWLYVLILISIVGLQFFNVDYSDKKIDWKDFQDKMLKSGDVNKLVIYNNENLDIYIKVDSLIKEKYKDVRTSQFNKYTNPGPHYSLNIGSIESFEKRMENFYETNPNIEKIYPEYETRKSWLSEVVNWLFFISIGLLVWMLLSRKMLGGGSSNIFNISKSKAKLLDKEDAKLTFEDVAGQDGAKMELKEIVDFLKNPEKYTTLGGRIPKGALLIGPPGTGKTLLAKAVSGEANVPFFSLSGSDFVEMFVGVGAARVRDLFKTAKSKTPCIIFIDELDAIGRARGKVASFNSNDERENTLNQLLTEMDGFSENSGVIVLAATNRQEILDSALLRPGRFDRQIHVELPDIKERKLIFIVHSKKLKMDDSVDLEFFSKQTSGFSGADIANLCNEAALIAARKNKKFISKEDFLDAIDRIVGGLEKKDKVISQEEKKVIAFHESGHATASWFLKHADSLVKVSIVPRGQSLGAAWYLPEERSITNADQLKDQICTALAGRAAEEIVFGKVSTGALNDLSKITKIAYAMIANFGFSDKIGNISFYELNNGSEYQFSKPYSEKTSETIDSEARELVDALYKKTKNILLKNKDKMYRLAELLLEKEVIFREDLETIFGQKQENEITNTEKVKKRKEKTKEKNDNIQNNDEAEVKETVIKKEDDNNILF